METSLKQKEKCKFDLIEPSVWLLSDTDHGCLSKGGWCSGWRQSRSNQTFHVMEVLQPTLIKCQPVICYLLNIWWSCCYLHIMLPKRCCLGSTFWILLQKKKIGSDTNTEIGPWFRFLTLKPIFGLTLHLLINFCEHC